MQTTGVYFHKVNANILCAVELSLTCLQYSDWLLNCICSRTVNFCGIMINVFDQPQFWEFFSLHGTLTAAETRFSGCFAVLITKCFTFELKICYVHYFTHKNYFNSCKIITSQHW